MQEQQVKKLRNGRNVDTSTANGLTSYIVDLIKRDGGFAQRINVVGVRGRSTTAKGTPDVIACYNGYFLGVEVKIGRDKQSVYQQQWQHDFERAGGVYVIVKDAADFGDFWSKYKRQQRAARLRKKHLAALLAQDGEQEQQQPQQPQQAQQAQQAQQEQQQHDSSSTTAQAKSGQNCPNLHDNSTGGTIAQDGSTTANNEPARVFFGKKWVVRR